MINEIFVTLIELTMKAIPGALATGITAIAILSYRTVSNRVKVGRSSFSGEWFGTIFDDFGNIKKSDRFVVSDKDGTATGEIYRLSPHSENERNWIFSGRIKDRSFLASYWSKDITNTSSGIWLMKQVNDNVFCGYYFRIEETSSSNPRRIGAFRMMMKRESELSADEFTELLGQVPDIAIHNEKFSSENSNYISNSQKRSAPNVKTRTAN